MLAVPEFPPRLGRDAGGGYLARIPDIGSNIRWLA
jgi:hypothetical protein